jgi:hypothetical protein
MPSKQTWKGPDAIAAFGPFLWTALRDVKIASEQELR